MMMRIQCTGSTDGPALMAWVQASACRAWHSQGMFAQEDKTLLQVSF